MGIVLAVLLMSFALWQAPTPCMSHDSGNESARARCEMTTCSCHFTDLAPGRHLCTTGSKDSVREIRHSTLPHPLPPVLLAIAPDMRALAFSSGRMTPVGLTSLASRAAPPPEPPPRDLT